MNKRFFTIGFFCFFGMHIVNGQNDKLQPPKEGKSVVYFVRYSSTGFMYNFQFFEKDNYIGKFKGINYLRHECDPGEKLFWVMSGNVDFIEAELKPGATYIVEVTPVMGFGKAGVNFTLVDYNDETQMKWINKTLKDWSGISFKKEELEADQLKLQRKMIKGMRRVQEKRRADKNLKVLSKDMTYSYF